MSLEHGWDEWARTARSLVLPCGCEFYWLCDEARRLQRRHLEVLFGDDPRFPSDASYNLLLSLNQRQAILRAHLDFALHRGALFPPEVRERLYEGIRVALLLNPDDGVRNFGGTREEKRDEAQVAILALMHYGASLRGAAEALNVPIRTVYYWRKRDDAFLEAVERMRSGDL